jgi:hypothetical protein
MTLQEQPAPLIIVADTETPPPFANPPESLPQELENSEVINEPSNPIYEEVASAVQGASQEIIETIIEVTQNLVQGTVDIIADISTGVSEIVQASTRKLATGTPELLTKISTLSKHITGGLLALLQRDVFPKVPGTFEEPAAITIAVTGASTFSAMLLLQVGLRELLTYLSVFATTGALPVRRESRRYGLVFDAITGQPLSGVLITVTNQAGVSAQPAITNASGMYTILVPAGEYYLQAHKEGYALQTEDTTQRFFVAGRNRYRGGSIAFVKPGAINFDIALRHEQEIPKVSKLLSFYHRFEKPFNLVFKGLFYIGFVLSVILTAVDPNWFHIAITALYLPLFFFEYLGLSRTAWGETLLRKTKHMAPFASIKLLDPNNQMTARTIADEYGRYYLIAPAGEYQMVAEFNDMRTGAPLRATASLHLKKDFNYLSRKIYL